MNELEWVQQWAAKNPEGDWVELLSEKGAGARQFRLFSCACCRLIWDLLTYEPAREAVEVSERVADGLATEAERNALEVALFPHHNRQGGAVAPNSAYWAALAVSFAMCPDPRGNPAGAHFAGYIESHLGGAIFHKERRDFAQHCFLRLWSDIFGVFFRGCPVIDPSWLAWSDRTVPKLAESTYNERELPSGQLQPDRLVVLADALEDAGCPDADLLGHLRQPGPHVRGCWAVDLVRSVV
jgi:hypothetical protein